MPLVLRPAHRRSPVARNLLPWALVLLVAVHNNERIDIDSHEGLDTSPCILVDRVGMHPAGAPLFEIYALGYNSGSKDYIDTLNRLTDAVRSPARTARTGGYGKLARERARLRAVRRIGIARVIGRH